MTYDLDPKDCPSNNMVMVMRDGRNGPPILWGRAATSCAAIMRPQRRNGVLRRAMIGEQSFEGRRENLTQANKLSRTYAALVEALNGHRKAIAF